MAEALLPNDSENQCEYEYTFSINLLGGNESCLFSTGLLDWSIAFDNNASTITLICCVPDNRPEWSIQTRVFVKIVAGWSCTEIIKEESARFTSDDPPLAFSLSESQNYKAQAALKYGQLETTIKMSIIEENGLWPLVSPSPDFMTANSLSNAELLLNGKKLYVNLDLLSIHSVFFATELEKMKQPRKFEKMFQITISGIHFDTMKALLRMIYYDETCITDTNVGLILHSAKKLKFETILLRCEEFLLQKAVPINRIEINNPLDLPRLIHLAHDYDLCGLQYLCLKSFGPRDGNRSSFRPASEVTAEAFSLPDVEMNSSASTPLWFDQQWSGEIGEFYFIDRMKWRIVLRKLYKKMHVTISPYCEEVLDYAVNWSIQISDIHISLGENVQTMNSIQFNPSNREHRIDFPIDTSNDILTNFDVEWKIQYIKGLRYFIFVRFAYNKGMTSTLKLQLEDKEIFVNLRLLAHFSSYFSNILETKNSLPIDEETNLPCLNLSNIPSSQMTLLLDHVYPTESQITVENVEELLLLADKFNVTKVVIKCVKFLETNGKFNLEVLQFAVNNKLTGLINSCLAQFSKSMDLLEAIKKDPFKTQMNKEVKVLLIDKIKELA